MTRTIQEERLLCLLKSEVNEKPISEERLENLFSDLTVDEWNTVMQLAVQNRVCPILFGAVIRNPAVGFPPEIKQYLERTSFQNYMHFYQMVSLVSSLLSKMHEEKIHGCILKGVTLSTLFPMQESRTFGDIDIYIPDSEEYSRMMKLFDSAGYQKLPDDMTDYHNSYIYSQNGIACDVELHYKLSTAWGNQKFDNALSRIYSQALKLEPMESVKIMDVPIPCLPITLEALYLLMHLFQHFMNKGFGLRLFLDWTVFWNKKGDRVNCSRLAEWFNELGLSRFVDAVNQICVEYLGMNLPAFGWLCGEPQTDAAEALLDDVFAGGDFGSKDRNRIIVTAQKAGIKAYLMELHRQTQHRFPKLSRYRVLLPILWVVTGIIFQYNNCKKRKVKLSEVLASSKKRNQLAQKLHIFKES